MQAQNLKSQQAATPQGVLDELLAGNQRFQNRSMAQRDLLQQVDQTKGGQWPLAVILGCIDSRAAPELIFDQGIGDVFCARVAGNIVNEDNLGSMEFACKVAGAKLVMVLGHSACGAVKGACDGVEMGNLTALLSKLRPAVDQTTEPLSPDQRSSANGDFVQAVAVRNVGLAVDEIRERSAVLRDMEKNGEILIVGGMYDIQTGAVEITHSPS